MKKKDEEKEESEEHKQRQRERERDGEKCEKRALDEREEHAGCTSARTTV